MANKVGVAIPCVTLFTEDLAVDTGRTLDNIDWLIAGGANAILVSGTCGEFQTLTGEERRGLITNGIERIDGRVPVYVGVMHTSTREAVSLARLAADKGATAVMSVPPYYSGPPFRESKQYFEDIAAAVEIPLIVYNNPGAAGIALSVQEIGELAHEGTAAMIKESHGDPARIHDLRLVVPDGVPVMYGEDYGAFEAMMVGADGWFAGIGNVIPHKSAELWELCASGDAAAARALWFDLLPFVNMTSFKPMYGRPDERPDFIQIFKAGLDQIGRYGGPCRRPLLPLPAEDVQHLRGLLDAEWLRHGATFA